MKRHTRPYGCTFPDCFKEFGSKGDWKRHENSQHFQNLMWRCRISTTGVKGACCAELFHHKDGFENHLKSEHGIFDALDLEREFRECRIGRNGQGRFWCGFCKETVELRRKGLPAWEERFTHIDDHFKQEKHIKDWLCLRAKKTKEEGMEKAKKERERRGFDDDPQRMYPQDFQDLSHFQSRANPTASWSPDASSTAAISRQQFSEAFGDELGEMDGDLDTIYCVGPAHHMLASSI